MIELGDWFWAKVDKNGPVPPHKPGLGPCWVWSAATCGFGHGRVGLPGTRTTRMPHRLSWAHFYGDAGHLCVLHKCDNPACVRPEHLFIGTRLDNNADMKAKSRQSKGAARPSAKLTDANVVAIRSAVAAGTPQAVLCEKYGLSCGKMSRVATGKSWRHVDAPGVQTRPSGTQLTETQADEIRRRLTAGERGVRLAVEFKCGGATISKIKNNTWRLNRRVVQD